MDDAARHEQRRKFAESRQAERGDYEADRGDYEADRGDYEADRGDYEADRGDYEADRGSDGRFAGAGNANPAVADIFRKAVRLGGQFVVSFVAPIGAASTRSRRGFNGRATWSESEAEAARSHVAALIDQLRQRRAATANQTRTGSRAPRSARVKRVSSNGRKKR